MPDREPRRDRGDTPPQKAVPERPPSRVAQERLADAVRGRAEAYRCDASVDLTLMEALLRMDEPAAAARALDDHRESLHAMARDLQVAVADAAVEREAEQIYDRCAQQLETAPKDGRTLKKRLVAVTSAAAVALVLILPSGRVAPRTMLASIDRWTSQDDVAAARERLQAARSWARARRADLAPASRGTPRDREAVVRDKVKEVLAEAKAQPAGKKVRQQAANVTDLDAYRTKRRPSAPKAETPDEPGLLPDSPPDLPKSGEPLGPRVPLGDVGAVEEGLPAAPEALGDDGEPLDGS